MKISRLLGKDSFVADLGEPQVRGGCLNPHYTNFQPVFVSDIYSNPSLKAPLLLIPEVSRVLKKNQRAFTC